MEWFEDSKRVIRICKSKKDRQHNSQKKNDDLQNITHKTKDRVTCTPLKTGGEIRCSGRVISSCTTSGIRCVTLVRNPVIGHDWRMDRNMFTSTSINSDGVKLVKLVLLAQIFYIFEMMLSCSVQCILLLQIN